ncbi:MAG: IS110 family transposase [Bacteroidales bacterium]|nr:IS110 family transposase [Bacteroidales bacterium]
MSKAESNRLCVGVDLHKTQFTVCALDEGGEYLLGKRYQTTEEGYEDFINEMHSQEENGYSIELAVETTSNARFFKNRMEKEGFVVKVVNTNRFKVITMSTKKTDANDAATLAYYLVKEMLPEAHLCSQTSEEIRRLLKTRSVLVQSMVKIKNQIHGMMLGYGIETKAAQFQSKKKRQELINDLADHNYSDFTASSLKVMLKILDDLTEEVKEIEKHLGEIVEQNDDVELLMTVPGIGINTATTIAAYTEDLERFEGNYKKFAAYVGIVPSVHNSNESIHYGRITKHGPQELRTAFVQAAMGMIRLTKVTSEWRLIKEYQRRKEDKGSGRAIIALARKISRIVFVMLSKRERFNPDLMRCDDILQQTA